MTFRVGVTDYAKDSNGNVVCENRTVLSGSALGQDCVLRDLRRHREGEAIDEYLAQQHVSSGTRRILGHAVTKDSRVSTHVYALKYTACLCA
jgi:hypothetical protein